jgi:hypothetical protein
VVGYFVEFWDRFNLHFVWSPTLRAQLIKPFIENESELKMAEPKSNPLSRFDAKALTIIPQQPSEAEMGELTDDIDCKAWLTEINMAQYTETFLVNLSVDNKHIRRKRLGQLRQQDLSSMNISNYAHQKRLMEHVRLVLKFSFQSPHRKKEIKDLYIEPVPMAPLRDDGDSATAESKTNSKHSGVSKTSTHQAKSVHTIANKKKQAVRRRSFDADVWNSISTMRKKSVNNAIMADQLRAGMFSSTDEYDHPVTKDSRAIADRRAAAVLAAAESASSVEGTGTGGGVGGAAAAGGAAGGRRDRARRWSFHGADANPALIAMATEKARAVMYGNMALEYDMMLTNLRTLQHEVLNQFKETLNCEVASLFFVNHKTRELLLYSDDSKWYRVPFGVGICGYCMETGENLNIPDAYADYRFNR